MKINISENCNSFKKGDEEKVKKILLEVLNIDDSFDFEIKIVEQGCPICDMNNEINIADILIDWFNLVKEILVHDDNRKPIMQRAVLEEFGHALYGTSYLGKECNKLLKKIEKQKLNIEKNFDYEPNFVKDIMARIFAMNKLGIKLSDIVKLKTLHENFALCYTLKQIKKINPGISQEIIMTTGNIPSIAMVSRLEEDLERFNNEDVFSMDKFRLYFDIGRIEDSISHAIGGFFAYPLYKIKNLEELFKIKNVNKYLNTMFSVPEVKEYEELCKPYTSKMVIKLFHEGINVINNFQNNAKLGVF